VDGTGSGSCPMVSFGTVGVETLGSAATKGSMFSRATSLCKVRAGNALCIMLPASTSECCLRGQCATFLRCKVWPEA
jgi:hypothetical protein